jgi:hypothetical protein
MNRALMLWIGEQADRCIDVCKIVFRLRNLSLIGRNPAMDFSAFVPQRLDD